MKKSTRYSITIGILFLIPFLAYGIGNELIFSSMNIPNYMSAIANNKLYVIGGGILLLVNSITVTAIGVMMYPILENQNKPIALGYLSSRILESLLLIVGLIHLLSIITISDEYVKHGNTISYYSNTLSAIAIKSNFWAYQSAMLILGIGSIGFCYLLYQSKLIPALLALLGLAGYILLSIGSLFEFFGYEIGIALSIPGGLFEVCIGIYLIVKGINNE